MALQTQLLTELLKLQQQQVASAQLLQSERDKLEIEKVRIEVENAKTLGEERRTDRAEAAKLRQQQREWAATARAKKKAMELAKAAAPAPPGAPGSCKACANPSDASLTPQDISYHYSGHTGVVDLFRQ